MRKDVKIGIGIGGVLLAVLIVYALVPKTNDSNDLARTGESESTSDRIDGGATAAHSGSAGQNPHGAAQGTTPAPGARDVVAQAPGGSTGQAPDTSAPQSERDATASSAAGSWDWDKIMDSGVIPEQARVGLVATPDDPFATPGPSNTGDDGVVWNQPGGQNGTLAGPKPNSNGAPGAGAAGQSRSVTPPVVAAPKGVTREHVIQQGENLSMIAAVAYGDARLYQEILKANPTLDERKLRPGMTIKIPDPSTFATATGAATGARPAVRQEAAIDANTQYRVAQGDSLHKIALKLYGKAAKADALYELNKDKIGDDSSRLKLGMVLKLPDPPTAAAALR